jgi:hypothetical protein
MPAVTLTFDLSLCLASNIFTNPSFIVWFSFVQAFGSWYVSKGNQT